MSEGRELTQEQQEFVKSQLDESELEYGKIWGVVESVMEDDNARLPYIPLFYRRKSDPEAEEEWLEVQGEKVYKAHQEEFCLTSCRGKGSDCMSSCLDFASKCMDIGDDIYLGLQKPYTYTAFQVASEDE